MIFAVLKSHLKSFLGMNQNRPTGWRLQLFIIILFVLYPAFFSVPRDTPTTPPRRNTATSTANSSEQSWSLFPHHVLQTKPSGSLSSDVQRWRDGCISLNNDHNFDMFDDSMLLTFTKTNYPQYLGLFQALSGVYMADMARVLLVYHFGGLYMDLDFYCHRSFSCLYQFIQNQILHTLQLQSLSSDTIAGEVHDILKSHSNSNTNTPNVLVLSREPRIHAEFIHHRHRCVIQDFYLATPKHPFLKWMLDSINHKFLKNSTTTSTTTATTTTARSRNKSLKRGAATTTDNLPKEQKVLYGMDLAKSGPFSYSIEKYLNQYYFNLTHPNSTYTHTDTTLINEMSNGISMMKTKHGFEIYFDDLKQPNLAIRKHNGQKKGENSGEIEIIYEMSADIIHPLIDASNSKLHTGCKKIICQLNQGYITNIDSSVSSLLQTCHRLKQKKYMTSTTNTMMVHMWTHSYLDFSFLRGYYDYHTYRKVERTLKPTNECNV